MTSHLQNVPSLRYQVSIQIAILQVIPPSLPTLVQHKMLGLDVDVMRGNPGLTGRAKGGNMVVPFPGKETIKPCGRHCLV